MTPRSAARPSSKLLLCMLCMLWSVQDRAVGAADVEAAVPFLQPLGAGWAGHERRPVSGVDEMEEHCC